jgi:hypothetical protein
MSETTAMSLSRSESSPQIRTCQLRADQSPAPAPSYLHVRAIEIERVVVSLPGDHADSPIDEERNHRIRLHS